VGDDSWYWGVVLRAAPVDPLLRRIAQIPPPIGVSPQAEATGHVTLFYAPLRGIAAVRDIAARMRPVAARVEPFTVELGGLGEFVSAHRVVAWLGVDEGADVLRTLRAGVCAVDEDQLPHSFHPHCTLAYGDDPVAYASFRPALRAAVGEERLRLDVDRLWIAGFKQGSHPARGLRYKVDLPLAGVAALAGAGAGAGI
jgi:2'-5' RNA ligase